MIRFVPFLLLVAACSTPSPQFRGIPATRVTVEGSTFDVRVLDNRAEALRVNTQYAPRFGPIKERARAAMAQVSGCTVSTVTGDQALAFGTLRCGKKAKAPAPIRQNVQLDCVPIRGTELSGVGEFSVELDCS